jgi:hypothetical protein
MTPARGPRAWMTVALLTLVAALLTRGALAQGIYFVDYDYENSRDRFSLHRTDLDGGNRREVLHDMGLQPNYASLEIVGDRIYWINFNNQAMAATLDGALLGAIGAPDNQVYARLADTPINAAGTNTYFPGRLKTGQLGNILRGDFEYENPTVFVPTREFSPNVSIVLDEPSGHIYWAGAWGGGETGIIQRANLADGSDVRTLLEGFAQDDFTVDLALDVGRGKMYWANSSLFKIQRANLDGSNVEDVVTDTYAFSIALDLRPVPEPRACLLMMAACAAVLTRRR